MEQTLILIKKFIDSSLKAMDRILVKGRLWSRVGLEGGEGGSPGL